MYHYALLNSLGDVVALFISYHSACIAYRILLARGEECAAIEEIV